MAGFATRPLEAATWPDFADLVERHKGVWGGCWCMAFHAEGVGRARTPEQNRSEKEARVRQGRAHAALVYDGPDCVGWCQFGPPSELPRIKHRRAYDKDVGTPPDWRITCFFADRAHRRRGVAAAALEGALQEIARLGGGDVEGYPEDAEGRSVSASFLYSGTVALFQRQGFERVRRLGKNHWVVARTVLPAAVRDGRTGGS
ncbi:acetyltransferase [Streptomyces viridochromogenes DSM 40736]|uniref:Acetyltransferase n=1 Tax=Streptomyces viridochromogenes (strain DSM 40736 / JCM 4977 / BCRC 1201 / Tue 494) TaxID=591159 RepID=D9X8Y3_STRVT|nr:GNAT family N-acetyltransferase [Streptomyces viridochromogenes]EFL36387.1 acetyltransferase [Streptomyces viridochromogenes DSM 40736]